MAFITQFATDVIIFILGIIISISSFYVVYIRMKMNLEWYRWFVFAVTGVFVVACAVMSGIFMKTMVYDLFLAVLAIIYTLNALFGLIYDSHSYKYY